MTDLTDLTPHPVWQANVTILPKAGVNDPAGESIRGGLEQLGYGGVHSVRAGKFISLEIVAASEAEARSEAERMCEQLLANPVIESYDVTIVSATSPVEVR